VGCTHCYAERNVGVAMHGIRWGEVWQGGQRVVAAESAWQHPRTWARAAAKAGERRRVFCASLADVLEVPGEPSSWPSGWTESRRSLARDKVWAVRKALDAARSRLWDVIRETAVVEGGTSLGMPHWTNYPGLDWLLLTKRPENWALVPEDVRPLVWLGTSASDQATWEDGVDKLAEAEGFRRLFVSLEPLVSPVDMGLQQNRKSERMLRWHRPLKNIIDWVIVGGESQSKARPCRVEWVRDVVQQCRAAAVPCFVKQLGARAIDEVNGLAGALLQVNADAVEMVSQRLNDKKGGDMAEWPEDLHVRELPHE